MAIQLGTMQIPIQKTFKLQDNIVSVIDSTYIGDIDACIHAL